MKNSKLRIGLIGAGRWARMAHIHGWLRDPRCELVVLCDTKLDVARQAASEYGVSEFSDNWQNVTGRRDLDIIDICTPSQTHYQISKASIENGKHVLCEKPIAYDYTDTSYLANMARQKGLKTKLGFTFRYTPAMRYAKHLISSGFIGEPYIFNGYEQNSQFLDPNTPLRTSQVKTEKPGLNVSSLEGYGAPIIDISNWWMNTPYTAVIGTMRNFVPERAIRGLSGYHKVNIDDASIFMAEYQNGGIGSIQTSYVTIGNFPGVEARIYGKEGAIIVRTVLEFGIPEIIRTASPNKVEFKQIEIPPQFYPPDYVLGENMNHTWLSNLVSNFVDEIEVPTEKNEGNFEDGARVQEIINAVELSFEQRRWVNLPLPTKLECA